MQTTTKKVLVAFLFFLASALGQVRVRVEPEFDSASVRKTEAQDSFTEITPGRLLFQGTTRELALLAYDLSSYAIEDKPSSKARYVVDARFDYLTTTEADFRLMLQKLLVDRFKLRVREETREMRALKLSVADMNKIKEVPVGPEANRVPLQTRSPHGIAFDMMPVKGAERGIYSLSGIKPIKFLGRFLELVTRTPVVDLTGLKGYCSLSFILNFNGLVTMGPGHDNVASSEPGSLPDFSKLHEMLHALGFRMQPGKVQVTVLVMESYTTATEN